MIQYENVRMGHFIARPNRFIAQVEIGGKMETIHVKNTGRCRELLVPGAVVYCQEFNKPERKTKFDLFAVEKGDRLINMDSQAPNHAVKAWLAKGGLGTLTELKAEVTHGDSRFDFAFEKEGKPCFMEVKGVTLEENGIVRFPDAPTERGTKHVRGLIRAGAEGFGVYVLFVVQMDRVAHFEPNDSTDPAFAQALRDADAAGVKILAVDCQVTRDSMKIGNFIPVHLQ